MGACNQALAKGSVSDREPRTIHKRKIGWGAVACVVAAAVACIMAMSSAFAGGGRTTASNGMLDASAEVVWAATGTDACAAGEAGAAVLTLGVRGSEGLGSLGGETVLVSYVLPDEFVIDASGLDAVFFVSGDSDAEGVLGSALMGTEYSDAEGGAFAAYSDLTPQQAARLALLPEPGEGASGPCALVQFQVAAADLAGASAEVSVPLALSDMSLAEGGASLPAGADGAILTGAMAIVVVDAEGGALSTLSCDAPVLTLAAPEAEEPEEPEPADESAEPDPAADEAAEPEESSEPADEAASEGEPADEAAPAEHGREGDGCCEPGDADDPLGPEQLEGIEDRLVTDPETDVSYDPETGLVADPETGGIVDPETGEVVVPAKQEPSEPGIGFIVDAAVAELAPQGEGALEPQGESEEPSQISTALKAALGRTMMLLGAPNGSGYGDATNIAEGTSGTCQWYIDADGKLTIEPATGYSSGELNNIQYASSVPWRNNLEDITSVYVAPNVATRDYFASAFDGCTNLESADLHNLNTANAISFNWLFGECESLANLNISGWNTAKVTNMSYMFSGCSSLTSLNLSHFNTARVINMDSMFSRCKSLQTLTLTGWNTAAVKDMGSMFINCESLTPLNISHFNTANVTDMSSMFWGCASLTTIDVSNFNTANVTDMSSMFNKCSGLTTLDVSDFDVSHVGVGVSSSAAGLASMFNGCTNLTCLDLSDWDTSNVKNFGNMFSGCSNLERLDVSGWDTSSATAMQYIFNGCEKLTTLDLSGWNTENNGAFNGMFCGCSNIHSLDISSFSNAGMKTQYAYQGMTKMLQGLGAAYDDGPTITFGPGFQFKDEDKYRPSNAVSDSTTPSLPCLTLGDLSAGGDAPIIASQQQAAATGTNKSYVMAYCVDYDANGGTFADGSTKKTVWYRMGSPVTNTSSNLGTVTRGTDTLNGWDLARNDATVRVGAAALPWTSSEAYCQNGMVSFLNPVATYYAEWAGDAVTLDTGTDAGALLYKKVENQSSESDAPSKTFTYTVACANPIAPLPSGTVVATTNGAGEYLVDLGELAFPAPGVYTYSITEAPAGTDDAGWLYNSTTKLAEVVVIDDGSALVVQSVTPAAFTNIYAGGKNTGALDDDDASDTVQRNWQTGGTSGSARQGDSLFKGAEWTDQDEGEAQINLVYNTPNHDSTFDAVYLLCNCDSHGLSRDEGDDHRDMPFENIKFLISQYERVDVIVPASMKDSGVQKIQKTFYSDSTDAEIKAFLDGVPFTYPCHLGGTFFLKYLEDYLGVDASGTATLHDPSGIFLSFDGSRGFFADGSSASQGSMPIFRTLYGADIDITTTSFFLPDGVSEQTMTYLADKQKSGAYYLLSADSGSPGYGTYDYDHVYNSYPLFTYLALATVSPAAYVDDNAGMRATINNIDNDNPLPIFALVPGDGEGNPLNVFSYNFVLSELDLSIHAGTDIVVTDVIDPRFELDGATPVTLRFSDGTAVPTGAYTVATESLTGGAGTKVTVRLRAAIDDARYTNPVSVHIAVALPDGADGYFYDEATDSFDETNVGNAVADVYDVQRSIQTGELTPTPSPVATLAVESPLLYKGEDEPVPPVKQVFEQGKTVNIDGETIYTDKTYTYSISWENVSSKTKTATFTDTVPEGVTFVSASTGGVYDSAANTVTWSGVNVAAGDTATVTFDVTVDDDAPGATIRNKAVVNEGKVDLESNETENPVKNTPLSLPFPTTGKGGFEIVLAAGVALLAVASLVAWRIRRSWQ